MSDDIETSGPITTKTTYGGASMPICRSKEPEAEGTEASCKAFGYLRGIRDSATSVEFRFLDGNRTWFPYSLDGNVAAQPFRGPVAEIHRGFGLLRADPRKQSWTSRSMKGRSISLTPACNGTACYGYAR